MTPYEILISLGTALVALNGARASELVTTDELASARAAVTRLLIDATTRVTS